MESPLNAPPTAPPQLSPQEYAESRHGVWMSSAALLTDDAGRVLIVRPSYRADGRWLLPGGGVEAGEGPLEGCLREVREEVGLELVAEAAGLLACCWLSARCRSAEPRPPAFPGDVMTVFDGGVLHEEQIKSIRLQADEITEAGFHDSATAAALLTPLSAKIMLAALRARLGGTGTAYLESGRHVGRPPVLDRHDVHVQPWPAPSGTPAREVRGWLFAPDGRVVLTVDPHPEPGKRVPTLPGGAVLPESPPAAALVRRAAELTRLALGGEPLAVASSSASPTGLQQLAAPVAGVGPVAAAPATGRAPLRLLAEPGRAAELLGGGEVRGQAARAAASAMLHWHLPTAPPGPVTEIPAEGMTW